MVTGFVVDDRQSFETVFKFDEVKYDEESLSNEERSEIMQQKELIDEFLDGGTQSIEDDLEMKLEKGNVQRHFYREGSALQSDGRKS